MNTTIAAPVSEQTQPKKPGDLRLLIDRKDVVERLKAALPKYFTPESFASVVRTAIAKTPKLLECTPESFLRSVIQAAAMGIAVDGRNGHLIPRKNYKTNVMEASFQADYKGLVQLVRRNESVRDIYAVLVRVGDKFRLIQGLHRDVQHEPDIAANGAILGAYAVIVYPGANVKPAFDWMSRSEIELVRNKSESWQAHVKSGYQTPWKDSEGEMFKKTVLKRLLKMANLSQDTLQRVNEEDEPSPELPAQPQIRPSFAVVVEEDAPTPAMHNALEDEPGTPATDVPQAEAEPPLESGASGPLTTGGAPIFPPRKKKPKPSESAAPEPDSPFGEGEFSPPPAPQPGWEKIPDAHERLRGLCHGYADIVILKMLKFHNIAPLTATSVTDVPAAKIMELFGDPDGLLRAIAEMTPQPTTQTHA